MRHISRCALAGTLISAISLAQFGGQYPGGQIPGQQPGRYPGGTGGGNGGGIPFPRKSSSKKKADNKKQQEEENLRSVSGLLRKNSGSEIVLETEDKRIVRFSAENVKFLKAEKEIKPDQVQLGDHVTIDYSQDENGKNYAARVNFDKAGTAQEHAAAKVGVEDAPKTFEESSKETADSREPERAPKRADSKAPKKEEEESPTIARNSGEFTEVRSAQGDADGPPKLTRSRPPTRKPGQRDEEGATVADSRVSAPKPEPLGEDRGSGPTLQRDAPKPEPDSDLDPFIEKAREVAYTFVDTLPNYTVKQLTTRYVSGQRKNDWQPVDNISTDLVYENGREQYRNVLLNGKPSKGKAEETGAWSTGEFATVLKDVFATSTNADFKQLRSSDRISNRDSRVYNFYVKQPNSHWRIIAPGEEFKPAYRGTIWIDKETSRVLRIEMQSRNVPEEFPIDKVESATDYEFVRMGSGSFLLPVHSETLSCMRGTSQCSRNVIEFRNYKKFGSESNVTFTP